MIDAAIIAHFYKLPMSLFSLYLHLMTGIQPEEGDSKSHDGRAPRSFSFSRRGASSVASRDQLHASDDARARGSVGWAALSATTSQSPLPLVRGKCRRRPSHEIGHRQRRRPRNACSVNTRYRGGLRDEARANIRGSFLLPTKPRLGQPNTDFPTFARRR